MTTVFIIVQDLGYDGVDVDSIWLEDQEPEARKRLDALRRCGADWRLHQFPAGSGLPSCSDWYRAGPHDVTDEDAKATTWVRLGDYLGDVGLGL